MQDYERIAAMRPNDEGARDSIARVKKCIEKRDESRNGESRRLNQYQMWYNTRVLQTWPSVQANSVSRRYCRLHGCGR